MNGGADLLVVGGGPAGAALAALVAQSGARVELLERACFPRDKVCGEFMSAEGCDVLQRLGLLEGLISKGAPSIDACRISGLGGQRAEAPLPESRGISRELLDTALIEHAGRCGARILERHEATAPVIESGLVRGVRVRRVGRASAGQTRRALLVAAADGR